MTDGLPMPPMRLSQNDGIEVNGMKYRVIRAYEPMFKAEIEVTCIASYDEGIIKLDVPKDELVKVIDIAS